jgi:UDP-N-acetylmuramyl tripeptide synthase
MKKDGHLTTAALIKAGVIQIQLTLKEKKKKSAIGTNGTNGKQPVLINQIYDQDQEKVDAIRNNGYKGQNYNRNHQHNRGKGNSNLFVISQAIK